MIEHYVTDKPNFKVKVVIKGCISPAEKKCVEYVREQYDSDGALIDTSTYQYFMTEAELIRLGNILVQMQ